MSHRVKAWLSSIRRSHSVSSMDEDDIIDYDRDNADEGDDVDEICRFDDVPSDVTQYILSFLHYSELHGVRLIGKQWNNLCDIEQKILHLNKKTPTEHLKYWMLKLRNAKIINLSYNNNVDTQFLVWLKREYLPLKIKEKQQQLLQNNLHQNCKNIEYIHLNLHIDISFCFGINCVEVPQLYGRGGVDGYNDYLKKLINSYTPYGCTFNFYGNYKIINPSITLTPRHVVLLQLYSLKYDQIQHCFKFASLANRQFTGPLPRFERMIKNGYPMMINWESCNIIDYDDEYSPSSPISSDDDESSLYFDEVLQTKKSFIVTIIKKNKKEKFKWMLSKQQFHPYSQCWMTDSVMSFYGH